MTQIAFGSGFKSIREFNHAIRLSTGLSPTELRALRMHPGPRPILAVLNFVFRIDGLSIGKLDRFSETESGSWS